MSKSKKFGTFSGVFTPSILTILGVIMYLRFPSIIGQAGLINTIGIILIAHIISITTSLSVASLSTDKPVKTGGTYFMISRSLGLPIGGTLGLALFVGLSFSVSLYLIGFAESFLTYWGMDTSLDTIRITGTIVLIAVATITFISTSLAIKSQYFIMAAIGLSLLSIFLGKHSFAPDHIHLEPLASAAPFMVLFGIFFPAVTGFEAGVSMSGDLKNPKKSLPIGAMMAVGMGFLVYLGLALFYSLTVDPNALVNDPQILFKISLVPWLVIAGIWGATLSSALGSILGAPRILQAIAMDKIAPSIFAKGTGKTNEPRNALLLAALIAEAGILIGQLDIIARIVSMFFITTYGFLNLAAAIESWSSSDFRPAFKIPRFVSILGSVSAFIVMILLDFLALAGATLVLGLLYFFLQRKELILESGDAWSSFWTNLAKRSLLRLNFQKATKRNWRPNIILFSGGEQARPHLVETGLSLTGKLGTLTDFDLISDTEQSIHPDKNDLPPTTKKRKGYFSRQFNCTDIETGIKTVTSVYGFSGFEPNTILMGWSRNTENFKFLANVLTDFKKKNLNGVFLYYDKKTGFGQKEKIDIWWNGQGRHLSFALSLVKFILLDPAWRDAEIRVLIINNDSSLTERLYRNTTAILEEKRMTAEVKIISDDFGKRSREGIINTESINADLVILGLKQNIDNYTPEYLSTVSNLKDLPASRLILSPSDEFEEINITGTLTKKAASVPVLRNIELTPLPDIDNKVLKIRIEKLDADCFRLIDHFTDNTIHEAIDQLRAFTGFTLSLTEQSFSHVEKELKDDEKYELSKALGKDHKMFLQSLTNLFDEQNKNTITETSSALSNGLSDFLTRVGNYIYDSPEFILVPFKFPKKNKEKNFKVLYHKLLNYYLNGEILSEVKRQLILFEKISVSHYAGLRKNILRINDIYEKLQSDDAEKKTANIIANEKADVIIDFNEGLQALQNFTEDCKATLYKTMREIVVNIAWGLSSIQSISQTNKTAKSKLKTDTEFFETFSENWTGGMNLINNSLYLDCLILSQQEIIESIIQKHNEKLFSKIHENITQPVLTLSANIEKAISGSFLDIKPVSFPEIIKLKDAFQDTYYKMYEFIEKLPEEIMLPEAIPEELPEDNQFEFTSLQVRLNKVSKYYFDMYFYEPYYRELEQLEAVTRQAIIECQEANSLLRFRIENLDKDGGNDNEQIDTSLLRKLLRQTRGENEKINEAREKAIKFCDIYLKNTFSKLYYHAIADAEKSITVKVKEQKGKKLSTGISNRITSLRNTITNVLVNILNSTSRGLILSKKYLKEKKDTHTGINQLLDFVEEILPDKSLNSRIPVFYRTLFNSKSVIGDEFWVPRTAEVEALKNAFQRHKNGFGGAVLVTGEHGAGKTTLTRYITNHLFKSGHLFAINPPLHGTANIDDFLDELRRTVGSGTDFHDIFAGMPPDSALVINNFELWWERTKEGYRVIEKIIELIKDHGKRVFVILNCNIHAFDHLKKITSIEDNLLCTIECGPFNSKQLQQLILNRHKSSGLTLQYRNKTEDALNQLNFTLLFNAYFNYSEGIPGVAMDAWLANIVDATDDIITIQRPRIPTTDVLYNIEPDWLVIIALFIQHKNMDTNKLVRVTDMNLSDISQLLNNLVNAGILISKADGIYTVGRYIEPFLVKLCMEKGII